MKLNTIAVGLRALGSIALLSLAACAPSSYLVKEPTPSTLRFATEPSSAPAETQLSILDERFGDGRTFSSGVLKATLTLEKDPIDPIGFFTKNVGEELAARGLPIKTTSSDAGIPRAHLKVFRIQNYRSNGYSPFFTHTYISADLETAAGMKRIGVYVRRGKVPVFSFGEVVEPVFNQPLSIAVKEFASKVARAYDYQASDSAVTDLMAKVTGARTPTTYLDVYELGFTNNPKAIDTLVSLTKDADEYVRLAAISSLGNIGATSQLGLLQSIYQNESASRQDRDMAIKAMGDLGTPEAKDYAASELKKLDGASTPVTLVTSNILGLYL